jgi:hypothetical protein
MDSAPVPAPSWAETDDATLGAYDGSLAEEMGDQRGSQGSQMAESPFAETTNAAPGSDNKDMDMAAGASSGDQSLYRAKSAANDFEMRLFSNKEVYRRDEAIMIWASLEYMGADDSVTVWGSGDAHIVFAIYGDDGLFVGGALNGVRKEAKLKKGEVYTYYYDKGNIDTFAPDDNREYWEAFFSERDLYLPAGDYTIVAAAAFSLSEDLASIPNRLRCELEIRVE